jgi:hypothetical protein
VQKIEFEKKVMDVYNSENSNLYEPEIDDLWFLYSLIKDKCVTSILEYGSGWSTYVMAIGLYENFLDFGVEHARTIRHPNPFKFMTIDASNKFQESAMNRIPVDSRKNILPITATPNLIVSDNAICHQFDFIPNFAPDLIYLDGPDHDQVIGIVEGFEYKESFTQPMGIDLLMIEPFLWPETILVTDGRTANARFLASRFKRNWHIMHDPFGDRTIFRLNETPLGLISEEHINFRLTKSRKLVSKELPQRN